VTEEADSADRVVVTKDSDFRDSHLLAGKPRRLLVVQTGNITNNALLALFDATLVAVVEAFEEADTSCTIGIRPIAVALDAPGHAEQRAWLRRSGGYGCVRGQSPGRRPSTTPSPTAALSHSVWWTDRSGQTRDDRERRRTPQRCRRRTMDLAYGRRSHPLELGAGPRDRCRSVVRPGGQARWLEGLRSFRRTPTPRGRACSCRCRCGRSEHAAATILRECGKPPLRRRGSSMRHSEERATRAVWSTLATRKVRRTGTGLPT